MQSVFLTMKMHARESAHDSLNKEAFALIIIIKMNSSMSN